MDEQQLSVQTAASRVGLSEYGLRKALDRGELTALPEPGPVRLDPAVVEAYRRARQDAALARMRDGGVDLARLAVDTAAYLRPPTGAPVGSVGAVGRDVRDAFGPAAMAAAAIRSDGTCRWCAAAVAAGMLGTELPGYSPFLVELFGAEPCPQDVARFGGAVMARLRARVHAPGVRPARAPVTPPRVSSPPPAPAARTAAARPATAPARKSRYVGSKACGTPVGTACSCHPGGKPITAAANPPKLTPPRRARWEPHGCGCRCAACEATR